MKKIRLWGMIFCLFALLPGMAAAEQRVVLVTNTRCPVTSVSSLELRKIYFGIKVRRENFLIRGLRNMTNKQLDQIFHQTVVSMSSKSYKRRLLLQILNNGSARIAEFSTTQALLAELRRFSCNVTYMWEAEASRFEDLKIIKLLWQEN